MKFLFTFEDQPPLERTLYLINWLVYKNHIVYVTYPNEIPDYVSHRCLASINKSIPPNLNNYDVWLYSLKGDLDVESGTPYANCLNTFNGRLMMLSLDDTADFFGYKISPNLVEKTEKFIGNVWYKDKELYGIRNHTTKAWYKLTDQQKSRFCVIPSFHESSNFYEAKSITSIPPSLKDDFITFIGGINGAVPGQDARICTIDKITRYVGIKCNIKITGYCPDPVNTYYYKVIIPDYLKSSRVSFEEYLMEINRSKYSLCPKGNSPHLTYRFFESLRLKSLVFMTEISDEFEFYDPPIPNYHYIQYKQDASDLMKKINYYGNNLEEAERITENGFQYWKQLEFEETGQVSDKLDLYLSNIIL
jgi:hypothetical protein